MKKSIQFLVLAILTTIWSNDAISQKRLSVSGSRYSYTVTNNSKTHLKVTNDKSDESKLLSPSEGWTKNGNFGRRYFRKTELICKYDKEAYNVDKNIFERLKSKQLNQAESNLKTYLESNDNKLLIQFGLIAGSNVKTNSDDWLIVKFGKWLVREGSEVTLKGIDFYNTFSELQNIETGDDLLEYLNDNYGYEARLKDKIIREIDFLDYKSRKRGINAVINWAESIKNNNRNYEILVSAINDEYDENMSYINTLYSKGDIGSYTLNEIVVGNISFKTKTPVVTLSLSPLHYGNGFNEDWGKSKETVLSDKDGDDEYDFEDGLWNRNVGGKIQFAISPEMRISKKSQARLLLGVEYFNTAYSFDKRGRYSANFFETTSSSDSLQIFESETIDDQRISAELAYKMYLGRVFTLELTGGFSQVKNYINYNTAELGDGFTWANSKIQLSEKYMKPYYGLNLGIGKNKFHRGTHLLIGCRFFQFDNLELSDSYNFEDADTDLPINFKPANKWNYRINVGLTVGF